MKKQMLVVGALAMALSMPLVACGNASSGTSSNSGTTTATEQKSGTKTSDFDANKVYAGQWRGSVKMTGQTVYGTAGGTEQMLDVFLNEDGTAETKPCKNHEDLLTATGTWTLDGDTVNLELDGKSITMKIENDNAMSADPTQFGIDGFDSIEFALY